MSGSKGILTRLAYSGHGHALRNSLNSMKRAKIATLLTLLVLGISLALPAVFGLIVTNLRKIDVSSEEANSLTLYLHPAISDLRGVELAGEIQQREDIRFTRYISRDEALEMFSKQFSLADAADTLDENPLPGAILAVMATDDDDELRVRLLSENLQSLPEVEVVKYDIRWLKRLHAILALLSRGVFLLGSLLVVTALLVIGNTIRLEMQRRSDEISVSHMIGASPGQIRRPFLYSGLIYGIGGGLLACLLVTAVILILRGPAQELSGLYGSNFRLKGLSPAHIGLLMGFSTLIGGIGAWLAVRWQIVKIMMQET